MSTVIRPISSVACSTIAFTAEESVTSVELQPNLRPRSRTSSPVSSSGSMRRPTAKMSQPESASANAISRPRPLPAPVMMAALPLRLNLSWIVIALPFWSVRALARWSVR